MSSEGTQRPLLVVTSQSVCSRWRWAGLVSLTPPSQGGMCWAGGLADPLGAMHENLRLAIRTRLRNHTTQSKDISVLIEDERGIILKRFVSRSHCNSPWRIIGITTKLCENVRGSFHLRWQKGNRVPTLLIVYNRLLRQTKLLSANYVRIKRASM